MAYTGTLTTVAEITLMCGDNVSTAANVEANQNILVAQAESDLMLMGKYDFVTNYATLTAKGKQTLSEYCSRYAAVAMLQYKMSGDDGNMSRIEAENRINIHVWRMKVIEKLISNQDFVKQITG